MATYNTAFGSLPGVETLTGYRQTDEDEERPRDYTQQYRAQQQAQPRPQQEEQPRTPTFAEMQAAGQARPAPSQLAPMPSQIMGATGQAPAQPPMLDQLRGALGGLAAAAPAPAAAMPVAMPAPTSTAEIEIPGPRPTPAPRPMELATTIGGVGQRPDWMTATGGIQPSAMPKPSPTGTTTWTNVETPISDLPTYTAANPPPANAANGSKYRDNAGITWTKRAGLWAAEGDQKIPTGYASLGIGSPTLREQTAAAGYGSKLDALGFMRMYGTPSTPEEKAALAERSGMTTAQIDQMIASAGNQLSSQRDRQTWSDLNAWRAANPQLANDPYYFINNKLVPAPGGGFTTRPKTDDELRAEGRVPLWEQGVRGRWEGETFIPDPTGAPGGGRGRWANWTPPTEEAATTPTPQKGAPGIGAPSMGAPQTGFPQMGAPGMGAPSAGFPAAAPVATNIPQVALPDYRALTAAPAVERYTGSEQAMELRRRLAEQLDLIGKGPPEIQGQAYEAMRRARLADIEAQFGAERSKLEEELAARGLSASTIGAGRYGDVAGQQARAIAGLEADLLQQQAEAEARNRQLYLTGMGELAGMAGTQDLGAFEANLRARQIQSDINFRAAELQQDAALKGRELTLQQARDQAQTEYQRGQLALGYAEMGSRERMQTQQQTFEAGQNQLERNLRDIMQTRQLTSEEKRALDQLTLQREQLAEERRRNMTAEELAQNRFEEEKRVNGVLEAYRNNQLTAEQGDRLIRVINQIYNDELPIEGWESYLRAIGLDPAKWAAYKPNVRQKQQDQQQGQPNTPPSGPGSNNPPVTVGQVPPPSELSQYSNGQPFIINGVTYYLMNGRLVDQYGRQYAGSSE